MHAAGTTFKFFTKFFIARITQVSDKTWHFYRLQINFVFNKLVKTIVDAATLTSFAAVIGWIVKKVVKESFTADPSTNVMNYAKFTTVMAGIIVFKQYLEDQKILPTLV